MRLRTTDYARFLLHRLRSWQLTDIQYMPNINKVNYNFAMETILKKYIKFLNDLSRVERNTRRHEGRLHPRHRLNGGLQHIA